MNSPMINVVRGDFVMNILTGGMGTVTNVSGDRTVVEVEMRDSGDTVIVPEEEFNNWS